MFGSTVGTPSTPLGVPNRKCIIGSFHGSWPSCYLNRRLYLTALTSHGSSFKHPTDVYNQDLGCDVFNTSTSSSRQYVTIVLD